MLEEKSVKYVLKYWSLLNFIWLTEVYHNCHHTTEGGEYGGGEYGGGEYGGDNGPCGEDEIYDDYYRKFHF